MGRRLLIAALALAGPAVPAEAAEVSVVDVSEPLPRAPAATTQTGPASLCCCRTASSPTGTARIRDGGRDGC